MAAIRRAVVSVSDKRGVVEFASKLAALGVEILSTGGTAKALDAGGVTVKKVSEHTGAREILEGRVKTLHPRIHGGILARGIPEHLAELESENIGVIDLVVVNLYPFQQTVANPKATLADAVENIDIGGPTMVRAAAKNHERVTVVTDPDDYAQVLAELEEHGGELPAARRLELAVKAFSHTASYDAAIARYLSAVPTDSARDAVPERDSFPATLALPLERVRV
ncbi:MAG: bifunctional phosphoribosylaminoimidazolecarboxamide formyltransferase/IMP cyclohydrolase, partial [Deltaproteobacteria bacterium]|nr:bifunctional phosphoribosylaminoimidazolecarboxamide formyltransferase/IMP cyclohydrolase [Deltaproteobacteria bacterium]